MTAIIDAVAPFKPGAEITASGARFVFRHPAQLGFRSACLIRLTMKPIGMISIANGDGLFTDFVEGLQSGQLYGLRAQGPWAPERGDRFDPSKLLVDPYATRLDRPFSYDPRLASFGEDTATLVPKAMLEQPLPPSTPASRYLSPGGLIYEIPVRAFTMLHP
jgi:glycogen operon protein